MNLFTTNTTTTTTIFLLFFFTVFIPVYTVDVNGNCDHNHDQNDTFILPHIKEADFVYNPTKNLSCYPSLRIHADYSLLEESRKKGYIINELIPSIVDYFQGALRIKRPLTGPIQAPSELQSDYCNISESEAFSNGIETDLLIVVVSSTEYNTGFAARSSVCYRSSSGRPIVSKLRFNTENLPLPRRDPLVHERNVYLAMHEIIHSLGFLKSSYNYFVDEFGNRRQNHVRPIVLNGQNRTVLDVEPLTTRLRQHFGCASIPGALLENNGGANTMDSHFERRLFIHEVMTSGILGVHQVSEFSLAVLEGSGWYVPDYSYAEPFPVGEGQGCEFWEGPKIQKNESTAEYCTVPETRGCTATGRGGGLCKNDSKSDGYNYYRPRWDYDCENPGAVVNARLKNEEVFGRGFGSKCFSGTLSELTSQDDNTTTFCFKYKCKGSGLDTVLEVKIGDRTAICNEEGPMRVNGYSGELMCPDPLAYCNTIGKQYCPRNCMGRGECINNKCKCNPGYRGIDCSIGSGIINELVGGYFNSR